MDVDLDWCPVCETAIRPPPPPPSAEPQPEPIEAPPRPLPSNGSWSKLAKSRNGTIKGRRAPPPPDLALVPGPVGKLRRNASSGKNLASKMGALKVVDHHHAATGATVKRPPKKVQLVDAKRDDDDRDEDRPVFGTRGLYCSEACRRSDEAQEGDQWYGGSRSSDSYEPASVDPARKAEWPSAVDGESDDSPASEYYSSGAEGSGYDTRSRRYSSGIESAGRRSNDSISSLGGAGDTTATAASTSTAEPTPSSRLGALGGLHAMTPIAPGEPSPHLTARPLAARSKSDDGAATVAPRSVSGAVRPDATRQARSYDKELPMRRPPLLYAPNGSPLVQASFNHRPQPQPARRPVSTSPVSPSPSVLSPFTDSGTSTAPTTTTHQPPAQTQPQEIYGLHQRRNPSSNSLAAGRSPGGDLDLLSSSLGSYRSIHRPLASPGLDQFTPTPSTGVPFPGTYAHHQYQQSTIGRLRPGSSSSLASTRRDSSGSTAARPFPPPGVALRRPELLQAHSDSDTSSPPSSPGWPPLSSLPNPVLAGLKTQDAAAPRSPRGGGQSGGGGGASKSWSWDHLPPYVPQYPAMDVDLVRRSRSGFLDPSSAVVAPSDAAGRGQSPGQGQASTTPSSKKKLFIFNMEE